MECENRIGGGVAINIKNGIEFDIMGSIMDNLLECISINVRVSRKNQLLLPVYTENLIV